MGIAADEPERVARYIDKPGYLLPLVEADWHEGLCGLWCQYEGTLSPVYENACRSGCWFCHNQGVEQLRLLRKNYPDLWALLLKWDKDSPVTFKADGHTVHDFDRRFAMEDEGLIPTNRTFRWAMLDNPPKFVAEEGEQIDMNQWLSACRKARVLSLFDGMACGMLAMQRAGIEVDRYVAFEIDKYAVQTSSHNFPMIEHRGDVFQADFTEFAGFDFLIGGSPCTYWSIAQRNGRETEASGMGWELFCQYVRALREVEPRYFIYENNKSMSAAIRQSISDTFGFEPICINSALVSAQNRQRLYWVGKRNEDGTYSRVHIEQPEDRGILLRDVLDGNCINQTASGKSRTVDAHMGNCENNLIPRMTHPNPAKQQHDCVAKPVNVTEDGKAQCVRATCYKDRIRNLVGNGVDRRTCVAEPVAATEDGKGYALTASYYKGPLLENSLTRAQRSMAAEPVCMRYERSEAAKKCRKQYETGDIHHGFHELSELHPRVDGKTNTLSTVLKDNPICEPVCVAQRGRYADTGKLNIKGNGKVTQFYEAREDGKTNALTTVQKDNNICEPVRVGALPRPNGELSTSQAFRVYSAGGRSVNITAGGGGAGGKTGLYAIPVEVDGDKPTKAISGADGKTYPVYEVKDGQITIKGKSYPIKLADGFYIIRKLTVSECKRLQTVPAWYEFPVSDSQAYKMLGNGWTVAVIVHLIQAIMEENQNAKR